MVNKVILLAAINGLFFFSSLSNGQVCSSLGFICTSCTSLQLCVSQVPTSAVLSCPANSFCDTTSASYCSSTACTTAPLPFYNCTTTGRFEIGTDCSQYIFCSNSTTLGVLVPTLFTCPNGTVFNPATATCVLDSAYVCPGSNSTITTTPSNACVTAGRFPNTTDTTCQAYYFCFLNTNNSTFTLTDFTCPTTTVFNQNTQTCVNPTTYTCPF